MGKMMVFLFLVFFTSIASIEKPVDVEVIDDGDLGGFFFTKKKAYRYTSDGEGTKIVDITGKVKFTTKDQYTIFTDDKGASSYLIAGDNMIETFKIPTQDDFRERYTKFYGVRSSNNDIFPPSEINVSKFSAKSSLTENIFGRKFDYKIDWLTKKFYKGCSCHSFNYDELVPPWVEGLPDFGADEEIQISFKEPTNGITVLNGYVDVFRTHLFSQNNRLKEVQIISGDMSMNFTFQDAVRFTSIMFPKKVSRISMKIISVYPGSKYNDTAISAILGYVPKKTTLKTVSEWVTIPKE